jgi:hypothetical protein
MCVPVEELIFNTSSEHQTVDLSNKCMTKDFLRDFRHNDVAQRKHKGTSFVRAFRNLVLMTAQKTDI